MRGKPDDFWNLSLPRETEAYVPKLLAVRAPDGVEGRSLAPLLTGRALPAKPLYAETLVPALERPLGIEVRAWLEPPYKLIRTSSPAGETRR